MKVLITKKEICQKMFDDLKDHIGKSVICRYWECGVCNKKVDKLISITDFVSVNIGNLIIPFVDSRKAISFITTIEGKILYSNNTIPNNYNFIKEIDTTLYKRLMFGDEITNMLLQSKHESKITIEIKKLEKSTKENRCKFICDGLKLVKSNLYCEWTKFVITNTENIACACIVEACISMMTKLEAGCDFQEAENLVYNKDLKLTNIQIQTVISSLLYFYKDSNDYRIYLNHNYDLAESV